MFCLRAFLRRLTYKKITIPTVIKAPGVTLPPGKSVELYLNAFVRNIRVVKLALLPEQVSLAQWLEHWSCKPGVESSNLSRGSSQL